MSNAFQTSPGVSVGASPGAVLGASPGAVVSGPAGGNAGLWAAVSVLGAASIVMAGLLVSDWRASDSEANALVTAASPATAAAPAQAPASPSATTLPPAASAAPAAASVEAPVVRPAAPPKPVVRANPTPKPEVMAQAPQAPQTQPAPQAQPAPPTGVTQLPPTASIATPPVCVRCGVVESVTVLDQPAPTSGTGAVIGGVLGAVVGNQIGKGSGRTAATILGAIGGGVAGQQIEKGMKREVRYDVNVRMDDGSLTTIQQDTPAAVGARVTLESGVLAPVQTRNPESVTSQPAPVTPSGTRQYSSTLSTI